MLFVTYENRRNPHVTIHAEGCGQIAKRGGDHRHGQGGYQTHVTYDAARTYAEGTGLRIIYCSYCKNDEPVGVRILPMDLRGEFHECSGAADIQQHFFLNDLPFRQGCRFFYRKRSINASAGTTILFQCEGRIIASAILLDKIAFDSPDPQGYGGAYSFDPTSIRVFDPVDADGMRRHWPDFKGFFQAPQALPAVAYPAFYRGLSGISAPKIWLDDEEGDQTEADAEGGYTPEQGDQRPLVDRQIRARRGQERFRDALRRRYGERCLVTGCSILAVLEAAHIHPFRGEKDHDEENGLLLRADIHTLFDLDLLGIHPEGLQVEVHPDVAEGYGHLAGRALGCQGDQRPSRAALQERYARFRLRCGMPTT
jgi:hypothetical protein